jgi:uncharacterized membrane protein (DUF485 family)
MGLECQAKNYRASESRSCHVLSSMNGFLLNFSACHFSSQSLAFAFMSEQKSPVNWDALEAKPEFRSLLSRKARFIISTTVFFMAYYLTLPVLVGWFPDLMKTQILGKVNIAYIFALSQFIMAWIIAFIYVRKAATWDKEAAAVIQDQH